MKWRLFAIVSSSVAGAVAICLIALAIVSRKVYHRSMMASLVAFYFRLTVRHKSDSQVTADIKYLPLVNDVPYVVPRRGRSRKQQSVDYHGMTVVCVNINGRTDRAVVYLHGGGYVRQPRIYHWKYINKLASRVGNVIVPIYPKAPNHQPNEAFELLTKLYLELCDKYGEIVLMGDSSGGGLALALVEYWGELGYKQPCKTILFSPWVDLTLSNLEIEEYQKVDPLINASSERIWAKVWAADMSLTDPRISPIYGAMDKLGEIILYSGDREILYPDLCKLYEMMKEKAHVKFTVGRGMNHVYQIYPIPEARNALDEVVNEIENSYSKIVNTSV
ncbi:MAG: alpha/beta hydrolase [Clostridiales bacterium]|nr:alpha/beta hydrolase [Clostridiales bacterium]